jgi:translation initiation factor 1
MGEIDPITGLPKELGSWENIAKEDQKIKVYTVKRRFGKLTTIVEGFDTKNIDIKSIAKKLKEKMACGGTFKDHKIELQGDHKSKIKKELIKLGFPEETISVQ